MQVLSPKHACAFANGMEYFNTYGGCTAAGAAGSAVLHVLREEKLQKHAHSVGEHMLSQLEPMKQVCGIVNRRAKRAMTIPLSMAPQGISLSAQ